MHTHSATILGHVCTIRMPGAFRSVDIDTYIYIYLFKISMSHDLRVSSLAAIIVVCAHDSIQF